MSDKRKLTEDVDAVEKKPTKRKRAAPKPPSAKLLAKRRMQADVYRNMAQQAHEEGLACDIRDSSTGTILVYHSGSKSVPPGQGTGEMGTPDMFDPILLEVISFSKSQRVFT